MIGFLSHDIRVEESELNVTITYNLLAKYTWILAYKDYHVHEQLF